MARNNQASNGDEQIREGDWIRFYQSGRLVIEEVRYVGAPEYSTRLGREVQKLHTASGQTFSDNVIEVRRLAEWIMP